MSGDMLVVLGSLGVTVAVGMYHVADTIRRDRREARMVAEHRHKERELMNRLFSKNSQEYVALESLNPIPERQMLVKEDAIASNGDVVDSMYQDLLDRDGYSSKGLTVD